MMRGGVQGFENSQIWLCVKMLDLPPSDSVLNDGISYRGTPAGDERKRFMVTVSPQDATLGLAQQNMVM